MQNLVLSCKQISMKLMALLLASYLTITWTNQSLGADETIIAEKNNNAQLSNITLTPTEKAWLEKNHSVKVAVKSGWMPIEFKLESDKHRGLSIDYLSKIGSLFNIKFIVVNYTGNIDSEQADIISGVSNSNLKETQFQLLNQPFLTFPFAIYINKNLQRNSKISSLEDLNDLTVAVFKSGTIGQKLREHYPKIKLVYVDIADEAFDDLRSGNVDAYVGNEMIVDYHITVHRINYVDKAGVTPFTSTVTMAVRKDLPILASILSKGLVAIGPNNKEILNRWKINDDKYYEILIAAFAIIFIIFLLVLFRVYRLKQANKKLNTESQQQIWYQANFDHLTNLPNRHLLQNRLEQAKERADRSKLPIGILFIDLDDFKKVNDQSGHSGGDKLLIEAANRISACIRSEDTAARVGGDEFVVVLSDIKAMSGLEKTCQRILNALKKPFTLDSDVFYISASIGITVYPADSNNPEELLNYADQAMFEAKKLGRNRFQFFTESIQTASLKRLSLNNDIRVALIEQQFVLYYQPIINLKNSKIIKAEALIRWIHPIKGIISPMDFIPLAEESGSINELGSWVFNQAIKDLLIIRGISGHEFQLSINVSPYQFNNPDKLLMWVETIKEQGIPGSSICIEITEGLLLEASDTVISTISALRDAGIEFSIDDFGTGYSALAYLKKFHIEFIKIDKSFTQNLEADNYDAILCEAIIDMAHKLDIKVVAEGIETVPQKNLLSQFECDYGQGYLFAKPQPLSQLLEFLDSNKS
jgi:diguanylate cyclase (GGDEF)-like protein